MLYRNGYMNQERQIQDIRSFIVYQVDAIVFTPIQENNWEPILEEAAQAGFRFRGGPSCQRQRSSLFF